MIQRYRLTHALVLFSILMTPVVVIAGAIFWSSPSKPLSAADAYAALAIIFLIANPLTEMLRSYSTVSSTVACVKRIQDFLLLNEVDDRRIRGNSVQRSEPNHYNEKTGDLKSTHGHTPQATPPTTAFAIQVNQLSIKSRVNDGFILQNVTFSVKRSQFSLIVGPLGSGKSVLLKALLGEIEFIGSMYVDAGAVAYCDQVSWIKNCSIRQNITGQEDFDQDWYDTILNVCLLNEDLANIADGDEGLAGSEGTSLSGGQKQRVVGSGASIADESSCTDYDGLGFS